MAVIIFIIIKKVFLIKVLIDLDLSHALTTLCPSFKNVYCIHGNIDGI